MEKVITIIRKNKKMRSYRGSRNLDQKYVALREVEDRMWGGKIGIKPSKDEARNANRSMKKAARREAKKEIELSVEETIPSEEKKLLNILDSETNEF